MKAAIYMIAGSVIALVLAIALIGGGYELYAHWPSSGGDGKADSSVGSKGDDVTCNRRDAQTAMDAMDSAMTGFNDAADLAESTARIALAGPIGEMQRNRRAQEAAAVPGCAVVVQDAIKLYMNKRIEAMLAFASQESDASVANMLVDAKTAQLDAAALFLALGAKAH